MKYISRTAVRLMSNEAISPAMSEMVRDWKIGSARITVAPTTTASAEQHRAEAHGTGVQSFANLAALLKNRAEAGLDADHAALAIGTSSTRIVSANAAPMASRALHT